MVIEPVSIRLRDGREAVLRCLDPADAPALLENFKRCVSETDFLLTSPSDVEGMTAGDEREYIRSRGSSPVLLLLGCFVDGQLVGTCDLRGAENVKTRHRAGVGIAIQKKYWGLGIGTAMFNALINVCRGMDHVTQMELDVFEGNPRARALYEKMGFRVVGVRPNAVRLADGTMLNEYMMIRPVTAKE